MAAGVLWPGYQCMANRIKTGLTGPSHILDSYLLLPDVHPPLISRTHADRAPSASSSPVTPACICCSFCSSIATHVPTTPAARLLLVHPSLPGSFRLLLSAEELPAVRRPASMTRLLPLQSPAAVPSATPTSTTRQSSAPGQD